MGAIFIKGGGGSKAGAELIWSRTYTADDTVAAFTINDLDLSKYTHVLVHLQTKGTANPNPAVWGLCPVGETSFVTCTTDQANRTYQESRRITVGTTSISVSDCVNSTNQHAVPTAMYGIVIE